MSITLNLIEKYSQQIQPEITQEEFDELSGINSPEGSVEESILNYIMANVPASLTNMSNDLGISMEELKNSLINIGQNVQLKYTQDEQGNKLVRVASK